ncbi:hypothetical protein RFI_06691, partial [Reticulomyxa filosa]
GGGGGGGQKKKKKKRTKEFKLEKMYETKLITKHLRNYNNYQISRLAFNALLLLNVITIRRHMPHDDMHEYHVYRQTPAPIPQIATRWVLILLVEAIMAFMVQLQLCFSVTRFHHYRQQQQSIGRLFYRCMIVVYVIFWTHVLGISYITSQTHRAFSRFIANIFYILSFSVFPFRFFEVAISSIILAGFVAHTYLQYNPRMETEYCISRSDREIEKGKRAIHVGIVPLFVAKQFLRTSTLEQQNPLLKQCFESATVFQSDLMGFTELSSQLDPSFVVSLLHLLYAKYDAFATQFNVEKIETIGDAYICVSFAGPPEPVINFALNVASLHKQLKGHRIQNIFQSDNFSAPINIQIRIGIAHGRALGCILGRSCLRFHIFGKALNHAIQLEGACLPNCILACPQTKEKCENVLIDFKKHDTLDAYWVNIVSFLSSSKIFFGKNVHFVMILSLLLKQTSFNCCNISTLQILPIFFFYVVLLEQNHETGTSEERHAGEETEPAQVLNDSKETETVRDEKEEDDEEKEEGQEEEEEEEEEEVVETGSELEELKQRMQQMSKKYNKMKKESRKLKEETRQWKEKYDKLETFLLSYQNLVSIFWKCPAPSQSNSSNSDSDTSDSSSTSPPTVALKKSSNIKISRKGETKHEIRSSQSKRTQANLQNCSKPFYSNNNNNNNNNDNNNNNNNNNNKNKSKSKNKNKDKNKDDKKKKNKNKNNNDNARWSKQVRHLSWGGGPCLNSRTSQIFDTPPAQYCADTNPLFLQDQPLSCQQSTHSNKHPKTKNFAQVQTLSNFNDQTKSSVYDCSSDVNVSNHQQQHHQDADSNGTNCAIRNNKGDEKAMTATNRKPHFKTQMTLSFVVSVSPKFFFVCAFL